MSMTEDEYKEHVSRLEQAQGMHLALKAARDVHHFCIAAGVSDAIFDRAGELVDLLEACAEYKDKESSPLALASSPAQES